eukprot:s983_g25.t1
MLLYALVPLEFSQRPMLPTWLLPGNGGIQNGRRSKNVWLQAMTTTKKNSNSNLLEIRNSEPAELCQEVLSWSTLMHETNAGALMARARKIQNF